MHTSTAGNQRHRRWHRALSAVLLALATATAALAGGITTPAAAYPRVSWSASYPGSANDIAASDVTTWVIGTNPLPGGFGIYRWVGSNWVAVPGPAGGGALRIAVNSNGDEAWVTTSSNAIYRYRSGAWTRYPGEARDIAVAGTGVFIIGTNPVTGGYQVYRLGFEGWRPMNGGGLRISGGARTPGPYVVNNANELYQYTGPGQWALMSSAARDVAVTDYGGVWKVSTQPAYGGYAIDRYYGGVWVRMDGGAVNISVTEGGGVPWVTNSWGGIYRGTVIP